MKLLLTDATNALGPALEHELERESFNLVVSSANALDWTQAGAVADYIHTLKPDIVINTLGWAVDPRPDQLELLPKAAANLAAACQPGAVPLIHFSSYRVFGCDNKSRHSEKDAPVPNSDAGQSFLAAEQALQLLPRHIVLRLSWVLGSYGDNPLTRLLKQLMSGEPVQVNTRLRGAPTAFSDAARVAVAMAKQICCGAENWGVMHYCSSDACTHAEFAEQVIHSLQQLDFLAEPPSVERIDQLPETEPVSAVLSCHKARDNFGIQARSWRPSLVPLIKQWHHEQSR
ncbi:sugar nucleotide-binding protein [Marinimicrobium sp. ABcell2]|uniref:sugar nucleotide-binding protein n=1 Tax=Marinimicrobium sp. ABcell2 TaxID=3069751 RepID=UPI0027B53B72|nr:sugar nucleotide-binding protein [Marinimicrobium sp. ABcell2]MDQ2078159.1 sugar nucleotide-binding protein [Marinimicrobium sp. ABcell2]